MPRGRPKKYDNVTNNADNIKNANKETTTEERSDRAKSETAKRKTAIKKGTRELINMLFEQRVSEKNAVVLKKLGFDGDEQLTNRLLMVATIFKKAVFDGDLNAMKLLFEMSGESPFIELKKSEVTLKKSEFDFKKKVAQGLMKPNNDERIAALKSIFAPDIPELPEITETTDNIESSENEGI